MLVSRTGELDHASRLVFNLTCLRKDRSPTGRIHTQGAGCLTLQCGQKQLRGVQLVLPQRVHKTATRAFPEPPSAQFFQCAATSPVVSILSISIYFHPLERTGFGTFRVAVWLSIVVSYRDDRGPTHGRQLCSFRTLPVSFHLDR